MKRKLSVTLKHGAAMTASRVSIAKRRLVYVLIADRRIRYSKGRSRIAYIGTTGDGHHRIANSVATRAKDILRIRGVRSFEARVITCSPRKHVKTWIKLERALLIEFKELHGEVPHCNAQGGKMRAREEFVKYFRRKRIRSILDELR